MIYVIALPFLGNLHWAVIGDTWLNTGTHSEWGPHVADPYDRTTSREDSS